MYIDGKNAITFITYAINLMKREIISTILINTDNKYITKPIKALITCKQCIKGINLLLIKCNWQECAFVTYDD